MFATRPLCQLPVPVTCSDPSGSASAPMRSSSLAADAKDVLDRSSSESASCLSSASRTPVKHHGRRGSRGATVPAYMDSAPMFMIPMEEERLSSAKTHPTAEAAGARKASVATINVHIRHRDGRHSPYGISTGGSMSHVTSRSSGNTTPLSTPCPSPQFVAPSVDSSHHGSPTGTNQSGGYPVTFTPPIATPQTPPSVLLSPYANAQPTMGTVPALANGFAHHLPSPLSAPPATPNTSASETMVVVHTQLARDCLFVPFPLMLPPELNAMSDASSTPSTESAFALSLFVGQVRFETTPAELGWLLFRACGACATRIDPRGAGCFVLVLKSPTDMDLVRRLHKRVLFDLHGFWLARSEAEVEKLHEYVAISGRAISHSNHLPNGPMIVEEMKVFDKSTRAPVAATSASPPPYAMAPCPGVESSGQRKARRGRRAKKTPVEAAAVAATSAVVAAPASAGGALPMNAATVSVVVGIPHKFPLERPHPYLAVGNAVAAP